MAQLRLGAVFSGKKSTDFCRYTALCIIISRETEVPWDRFQRLIYSSAKTRRSICRASFQTEGGNGVIHLHYQRSMGSNLDNFELRQTILRTINSSPVIQNANVFDKTDETAKTYEEIVAETGDDSIVDSDILESMRQEEITAAQKCMDYTVMLREGGLTEEEEYRTKEELKKARQELLTIRQKYNSTDTIIKANRIIKNIKSPRYIADEKKRKGIFKFLYYGIDDPFYDGFEDLYGEEGLEGYRREHLESFKDISNDDVEMASRRYKRVYTVFTCIKTLVQIALWIASWYVLYPSSAAAGCNPLVFGAGMAILSQLIKYSEIARNSDNYGVFIARRSIAEKLGLMMKDKTFEEIAASDYENER